MTKDQKENLLMARSLAYKALDITENSGGILGAEYDRLFATLGTLAALIDQTLAGKKRR